MFLENLGIDAVDPIRLGRFWEAALGTTALTVEPDIYETRLEITGDAYLDLCFAQVPEPPASPLRLHLDLRGGDRQLDVADQLRELGARDLDIGQGEVPWIVLGDVEGTAFCVREERAEFTGTGPLAALPLDSADPQRDADFWAWLTGWADADADVPGIAPRTLRHPSRGPAAGVLRGTRAEAGRRQEPDPSGHPARGRGRRRRDRRAGRRARRP